MLIKRALLDQIVGGEVDLIFRKWRKPTVKTGGQLRTAVGMLDIISVEPVKSLRADDAARAGFESKAALVRELDRRTEGEIYRIQVAPAGPDPRIALRENAELSSEELADLRKRLARLDAASSRGPWTTTFLRVLEAHPHVRAPDLAASVGLDKPTFKNDVRKLKALGLTISFSPGYEVSPRGKAYLATCGDLVDSMPQGMGPSITTRAARPGDHDEIVACVEAAYQGYVDTIGAKPAPMLDDYATLIRHECVTVAVRGETMVGLIVMWARSDHWYVDNIAVWPDQQGQGIGTLLLTEAERVARAQGFGEIRLSTNEAMSADSTYYQRSGYAETHRSTEAGYRRINYRRALL